MPVKKNQTQGIIESRRPRGHTFLDETRERNRLFEIICWIAFLLAATTLVTLLIFHAVEGGIIWKDFIETITLTAFPAFVLLLARRGVYLPAKILLTFGTILITTYLIYTWEGIYAPFAMYYVTSILLTAIFLGTRLGIVAAAICILLYSTIILGQTWGLLPHPHRFDHDDAIIIGLLANVGTFISTALLVRMLTRLVKIRGQAISRSEKRYRELFDNAPDMIIGFNLQGNVEDANKRTCDVLGYNREQLINMSGAMLVFPEDRETLAGHFRSLLQTGLPRMIEIDLKGSEEQRIPVEVNHTVIYENGKAVGLRAVIRDITMRRIMQDEQEKMRQRLMLSEKLASLGQLVLGISHEYNNILAGLRGMAEVVELPGREERLKTLPRQVIKIVDRAQQVTRSLLSFAQRFEPSVASVSLSSLIDDAVRLAAGGLNIAHIKVKTDVPADLDLLTEAGKLQEVFLNLIINAFQAMPDGGLLTISAAGDYTTVRIMFSDTGPGIPPENLKRIFDPFFTTKGPIGKSLLPGTGLGLSLSYGIIQSLGGDLSVESEIGKGSTFTILLPKKTEAIAKPLEKAVTDAKIISARIAPLKRVLVLEDEDALRNSLIEFLISAGHEVVGVTNGAEALGVMDVAEFDVAFVDLFMAGISGEEFILSAHEKCPDLKFIIITGREVPLEDDQWRLKNLPNLITIMRKPFAFDKALDIIKESR